MRGVDKKACSAVGLRWASPGGAGEADHRTEQLARCMQE